MRSSIDNLLPLLDTLFEDQYNKALRATKDAVKKNQWDYEYTMLSFYDPGNPFTNYDYTSMIAAYAFVSDYGETRRDLLTDLPLLQVSLKATPVPDDEDISYAEVTFITKSGEDILRHYGFDPEDLTVQKNYEKRLAAIRDAMDNRNLSESFFTVTIANTGHVREDYSEYLDLVANCENPQRREVMLTALSLLGGVPYQWGGKPHHSGYDTDWWTYESGIQRGLDCSGFVQWVFMTAGYEPEITNGLLSTISIKNSLEDIQMADLLPGDIGLMNLSDSSMNHTGIYLGDGMWIHCSSSANTVVAAPYSFRYFKRMPVSESAIENARLAEQRDFELKFLKDDFTLDGTLEEAREEYQYFTITGNVIGENNLYLPSLTGDEQQQGYTVDGAQIALSPYTAPEIQSPEQGGMVSEEDIGQVEFCMPDDVAEALGESTGDSEIETIIPQRRYAAGYTEAELLLLAQLIHNEARGEPFEGKVAVGEVVMNRLSSPLFPNTIYDVIYQRNQFSGSSRLAGINPSPECYEVAKGVLDGALRVFNNANVLYFRNPIITSGISPETVKNWGQLPYYTYIGGHAFYTQS